MVVLLHNIRSLHNVGSIFRTADTAGVEKLYLCGITPSPLDRFKEVRSDVAKVALGAEKTVPWEKVESTEELVLRLKSEGYTIVALEQDKRAVPYYAYALDSRMSSVHSGQGKPENDRGERKENRSFGLPQDDGGEGAGWIASSTRNDKGGDGFERVALILGAEVDGVPASVLEKSDRIVEIPMSGSKESLNVAVAFGVIAFWLRDSQKANSKS